MVQSLLISSTRKSSGKTIISIGLSGLANNLGYDIQTFKKGPDFIDPSWLTLASRRPCYNLDFNTMGSEEIKRMYSKKSHGMDFSLIEGTKGLFDGISTDGADSNAELASLLKSNVLLVIDCEGITRGIAPLLEGYKSFGEKLKLDKVILNNVSTSRHESKLVSAISRYTDFRVLGVIPSIKNFIVERHLGLVPTFQHPQKKKVLSSLVSIIRNNTDYKKLFPLRCKSQKKVIKPRVTKKKNPLVVGVASDAAFGFYYPDDIERFKYYGVKIYAFECNPLAIEICKKNSVAMRIGTNHGSLSDRILSRYGDTPKGMVESAMEFLRICREQDYHEIVLSMKASNTRVMVQAYRLLVAEMIKEGMSYPLHLGVTEAGEGEEGRIKSAVGIGSLLADGIGDTIRVSLTEAPEF